MKPLVSVKEADKGGFIVTVSYQGTAGSESFVRVFSNLTLVGKFVAPVFNAADEAALQTALNTDDGDL